MAKISLCICADSSPINKIQMKFSKLTPQVSATESLVKPCCSIYGSRGKEVCLRGFANNKGADQSVISTFVIRLLESIIS